MTSRLFWKVFILFGITFTAIFQGHFLFDIFRHETNYSDSEVAARIAPLILDRCAGGIAQSGLEQCQRNLALVSGEDRTRLFIAPVGSGQNDRDGPHIALTATSPQGQVFQISYHHAAPVHWSGKILEIPKEFLILGGLGGLAFSACVVWYVVSPIRRVTLGFHELSSGNLNARVGQRKATGRDELADLGRDFDVMAARLQELVNSREQLFHDVSHEIRSPISRLHVAIAIAKRMPEKMTESIERIEREAMRMEKLVNELLALARSSSHAGDIDEYFDVLGVIDAIVDDITFEARSKGVDIVVTSQNIPSPSPSVKGNSELIRRAFENILRNAIKFSAPGQSVVIALDFSDRDHEYHVRIEDRGPGVPEGDLDRLFQPFVKVHETVEGFGLGLSIAQRALTAHGGFVKAANRAGGGLNVSVCLPIND